VNKKKREDQINISGLHSNLNPDCQLVYLSDLDCMRAWHEQLCIQKNVWFAEEELDILRCCCRLSKGSSDLSSLGL
jgi:hypothetical protein